MNESQVAHSHETDSILIVDHNPAKWSALINQLAEHGFNVLTTEDGEVDIFFDYPSIRRDVRSGSGKVIYTDGLASTETLRV